MHLVNLKQIEWAIISCGEWKHITIELMTQKRSERQSLNWGHGYVEDDTNGLLCAYDVDKNLKAVDVLSVSLGQALRAEVDYVIANQIDPRRV